MIRKKFQLIVIVIRDFWGVFFEGQRIVLRPSENTSSTIRAYFFGNIRLSPKRNKNRDCSRKLHQNGIGRTNNCCMRVWAMRAWP